MQTDELKIWPKYFREINQKANANEILFDTQEALKKEWQKEFPEGKLPNKRIGYCPPADWIREATVTEQNVYRYLQDQFKEGYWQDLSKGKHDVEEFYE